jgi:alkylated DNA repair dioxygenase AlkB
MKPEIKEGYIKEDLHDSFLNEVAWVNREAPRDECFMAFSELEYTYGSKFPRTYKSVPMHPKVSEIMRKLNSDFGSDYNVCFLNFYKSDKEHLGWHSDNSPEMDGNHPIAVISFGAERFIWIKELGYKGVIPDEDKYLLTNGSLFIMPAGFQDVNLHKIPKHDRPCGGRISLTYRRFKG